MSKIPKRESSLSPIKPVVFRQPQTTTSSQRVKSYGEDTSNKSLRIGDRIITNGKSGTVAFIGPTRFAEGEWVGINLDEAQGKNDGTHGGVRYFETKPNHGLFCRPDKVQRFAINGAPQRHSLYNPSRLSLTNDTNNKSKNTTTDTLDPSSIKELQVDDRVVIRGAKHGTLKYIGKIHVNEGIWCGIKLDRPLGKNDGKLEGVRYFTCSPRYGIFAPLQHVEKVVTNSKDSQVVARQSTISTDSYSQFNDSNNRDSILSQYSTSSYDINDFQPRSSTKIQQSSLSTDLTVMETVLSTQVATLREKIKEKDIFIEKLQEQNEKDRLELSHATEKINEMENHIITLQRQYEIKIHENEYFTKEQVELKQRLEDLHIEFEEYQLSESNKNDLIIPDNHHILSSDEIEIYEETKKKVFELESINKNLKREKQFFEEELKRYNELKEKEEQTNQFIDELKNQIELLKFEVSNLQNREQSKTSELIEKEMFYKQQIEEYQSKINQITKEEQNVRLQLTTLEQEKQANEKRVNDLLNESKRHEESIALDLEKQCQMLKSELQNLELTSNMTFSEREMYYEQQIKEYQANINQATYETEKVRAELKQIQEENDLKEKKTNILINELKQNYEKVQTELDELNDRERQANIILNQCESHYEKQIKEYENNLEQATHETQNIQAELEKLEKEKTLHENKSNTIIISLKQDYERQYEILKNQLTELQDQNRTQNIILNERIAYYEIQIKEYQVQLNEKVREIQDLQIELTKLQEEKTTDEQQLNITIDTLTQNYIKLQNELDNQENKTNMTLTEHESQYEQQIKEYKNNLEQTYQQIQNLQDELDKLQKEKIANENHLNDTINKLKHDYEILKTELQDQNHHEREAHYPTSLEIQNLQSELTKSQEEKLTTEIQLNETINSLKQHYERQYQELQLELDELNERERKAHRTLHQRESEFEQKIKEYQDKLDQIEILKTQDNTKTDELTQKEQSIKSYQSDLNELNKQIEELYQENNQLKTELDQKVTDNNQQNELIQCIENLTTINETLKKEINDLINKANIEQQYIEDQKAQERILKEKIEEYEMKIALLKSDFMVEMQNTKLDHDQEILRLKNQLQQTTPAKKKK